MEKLLEELKEYMQQMIDEVNAVSSDPDLDPSFDFDLGYIAGMGIVIRKVEGLINA